LSENIIDGLGTLLSKGAFREAEFLLLNWANRQGGNAKSLMRCFRLDGHPLPDSGGAPGQVQDFLDTIARPWRGPTNYLNEVQSADLTRSISLFDEIADELLYVSMIVPINVCNYRCSYCFLEHEAKASKERLGRLFEVIERLGAIPRPLHVEISPGGDIIATPSMWPIYERLMAQPNIRAVEIWTNLSRDLRPILGEVDWKRIMVVATYHPTEFDDFERSHAIFCKNVETIAGLAADVSVNFVASRSNLRFFQKLYDDMERLRVPLTVNAQLGKDRTDGQVYPVCYTPEERQIISSWMNNDFIEHFMLLYQRENVRCSAGRNHLQIDVEGNVRRCDFVDRDYGNILGPGSVMIDMEKRYCEIGGCSCKNYVGFIEPCDAEYDRRGTKHHYASR